MLILFSISLNMHYLYHDDLNHELIQLKYCRISIIMNKYTLINYDIKMIEITSKNINNIIY